MVDYNPFADEIVHGDPLPIYRRLRDEAPAYHLAEFDTWALSRFEDIWKASADTKHLTAERRIEEFIAGKGLVSRWEAVTKHNHWLDALALACVGGHAVGQHVVTAEGSAPPQPAPVRRRVKEESGWLDGMPPRDWVNGWRGRW